MKPRLLGLFSIVTLAPMVGCANAYRVDPVLNTDKNWTIPWQEWSLSEHHVKVEVLNPYTYGGCPDSDHNIVDAATSYYKLASDPVGLGSVAGKEQARHARNQLQSAIIRLSQDTTSLHLAGLKSTEANVNLVLGMTAIGLSAGAAAAPGAAQGLSAGAAFAGGSRALINEQVYRNALIETTIRLIDVSRAEKLLEIQRKQTLSVSDYNVEAAITDAVEYHERGSFFHGLSLLRAEAEKSAQQRQDKTDTKMEQMLPALLELKKSPEAHPVGVDPG